VAPRSFGDEAAACDALLRGPSRTNARVAIPWLHVISDHPAAVARRAAAENRGIWTRQKATEGVRLLRTAGRAIANRRRGWAEGLSEPRDVLFLSHLVSASHAQSDSDFYFGTLAQDLAGAGLTSLTLLRNHVGGPEVSLARRVLRDGGVARRLLPRVGSPIEEARAASQVVLEAVALRAMSRRAESVEEARAAALAASQAMTEGTLSSLRLHAQVRAVCRQLRPRVVVVTYEGHAWERLVFDAVRSVDRGTLCVGYQHTVLFPGSHAVARRLGGYLDPDAILTIGDVTRDRLTAAIEPPAPRIVSYGSHRRADMSPKPTADANQRCLVIPEGLPSECVLLCDLAWACAKALPHVEFVLRFHPVLPFEVLVRREPRFRSRPPNVTIRTDTTLAADAAGCRWALYRGSSAVLQAALAGLRPLYFVGPDGTNIDPLDGIGPWRQVVASVQDVAAIVARDAEVGDEDWGASGLEGRAFCEGYILPTDPSVVVDLLRLEDDVTSRQVKLSRFGGRVNTEV
jgi:hypothetical protein